MITVLIQTGLCLLAGLAMWKMWRVAEREGGLVKWVVFLGFTGRALLGTALFWISYLNLPIFARLQMGNGHWFFATDGRRYLREAIWIAEGGLPGIVTHYRTGASVSYVQTLATFTMLFGNAASVAVLLNLFSYLGMCLIIIMWCRAVPAARTAGTIAVAAISLSPSAILWSTQPLKDTLFQFLMVCLAGAGVLWLRAWRARPAPGAIVAAALIMFVTLFQAVGIRWYFGFIALVACGLFFLLTALTVQAKWRAAIAGVVTFVLLTQALVISASAYLPPYLQKFLAPWKENTATIDSLSPARLAEDMKLARQGFENSGGATSIGISGPLARIDEGRRIAPRVAPVTDDDWKRLAAAQAAAATAAAAPVQATTTPAKPKPRKAPPVEAVPPPPVTTPTEVAEVPPAPPPTETTAQSAEVTPAPAQPAETPAAPASQPAVAVQAPAPLQPPAPVQPSAPVQPPAPVQTAEAVPPPPVETQSPTPATTPAMTPATDSAPATDSTPATDSAPAVVPAPAPAPAQTATAEVPKTVPAEPATSTAAVAEAPKPAAPVRKQPVRPKPRPAAPVEVVTPPPPAAIVAEPVPAPVATTPAPAPAPAAAATAAAPEAEGSGMGDGTILMPTSTTGRLLAGAIAVLLPSRVARDLGLLEMGGGRGFWWFTDIDTFVFDTMFVIAIVFVVRAARRTRWATLRNPVFWLVLAMASVAVPIVYTITNYGTLFRLRAMLYLTLALIPLAVSMIGTASDERGAETEPPATSG